MQKRFTTFVIINIALMIIWSVYLFAVQVLDPHQLERQRRLRYTPVKEIQAPLRGFIYDRNRELLVRTTRFFQVDYDRSSLSNYNQGNTAALREDYQRIAEVIAENSTLSRQFVLNRLNSSTGGPSVYIHDRVRESDMIIIERELKEMGFNRGLITQFSMQQRNYTDGNLAGRMIGSVRERRDSGSGSATFSQMEGLSGIESVYDADLRGAYGWQKRFFDAHNNPVPIPNLRRQNVKNGNSLVLTIDSRIQEIVEMNLREGLENYKAKNAIGIFMNPKTGEILAMASVSAADKQYANAEIRALSNMGVSFMFEPGSTLKPVTSLVALEKKLYRTTDMLDCRTYRLPGRTIRDSHPFDDLSFRDVLVFSSNVGVSKMAEKMGANSLYQRLISLNFGNRTSTDFYGESAGVLRKVRDWQGFSLHSISFGQEIAVTPLQLAVAYSALANGGVVMRPYVVSEVIDDNNRTIRRNTPQRIRKVSNHTALDTLRTIMEDVVVYGTATGTRLPYVSIAGKTGTAEKQSGDGRGYTRHKYIANFAGFFPTNDPQYVGVVIYDEPAYAYRYASMSAVVSFRKITEQILSLPDCNIIPTIRMREGDYVTMPDVMGLSVSRAINQLERNSINYRIIGDPEQHGARVINQYPKGDIGFDQNQQVLVVVDQESVIEEEAKYSSKMPSLVGLSLRKAVQEAKRHQINLLVDGRGVIVSQSIPSGTEIEYGQQCRVRAN